MNGSAMTAASLASILVVMLILATKELRRAYSPGRTGRVDRLLNAAAWVFLPLTGVFLASRFLSILTSQ